MSDLVLCDPGPSLTPSSSSLLTKTSRFDSSSFPGGAHWVSVGFAASPPSQQLREGGKPSCFGSLDPPHSICVSVHSNWVGLMPWQDFLLQTAVLHAVILQQGLDGEQMDLLSCFPSCQPRAEAGQPCFSSRNISRGRLSISMMTQPRVGVLFPLLNQFSKEYIKNQHFKFLWELIAIKKIRRAYPNLCSCGFILSGLV